MVLKTMLVFRPSKALSGFSAAGANGSVTKTDIASQSVTASSGVNPLIVFGSTATDYVYGIIVDLSFSPAYDQRISQSSAGYVIQSSAYKIYNGTPSNITVDSATSTSGINCLQSFYLALT